MSLVKTGPVPRSAAGVRPFHHGPEPEDVSGKFVSDFWLNSVGNIVLKMRKLEALSGDNVFKGGIFATTIINKLIHINPNPFRKLIKRDEDSLSTQG